MDHLGGDHDGGIAGEVQHATPVLLFHPGQVCANQAYGRQDVDLEVAAPFGVVDLQGRGGAEDTEVVDENIDRRHGRHHGRRALFRGEIPRCAGDHLAAGLDAHRTDGGCDTVGAAAVYDDVRAGLGESDGDGLADALRGAGDQRGAAGQIDLHSVPFVGASSVEDVRIGPVRRSGSRPASAVILANTSARDGFRNRDGAVL